MDSKPKSHTLSPYYPYLYSLLIHISFLFLLSVIYFDIIPDEEFNIVFLEFNQYEKKIIPGKNPDEIPPKNKPNIVQKNVHEIIPAESINLTGPALQFEISDSGKTSVVDTLKYYSDVLDSMVVDYPSLLALKSAMLEKIKNNPRIETDSALVVRRMRKFMLDYYKQKFPTPLSKFGDPTPGIPIDKILDLFKGEDEKEELKKLK